MSDLSDRYNLPLDERIYFALTGAGFDEDESQRAIDVALPMFADFLRQTAADIGWRFRSASFACGQGESTHRIHPAGAFLRAHADALDPTPTTRRETEPETDQPKEGERT